MGAIIIFFVTLALNAIIYTFNAADAFAWAYWLPSIIAVLSTVAVILLARIFQSKLATMLAFWERGKILKLRSVFIISAPILTGTLFYVHKNGFDARFYTDDLDVMIDCNAGMWLKQLRSDNMSIFRRTWETFLAQVRLDLASERKTLRLQKILILHGYKLHADSVFGKTQSRLKGNLLVLPRRFRCALHHRTSKSREIICQINFASRALLRKAVK